MSYIVASVSHLARLTCDPTQEVIARTPPPPSLRLNMEHSSGHVDPHDVCFINPKGCKESEIFLKANLHTRVLQILMLLN